MPLRYVGRYPDTEAAVAPHSYAIAANDKTKITTDYINKQVDALVAPLAKTDYVKQQDDLKAAKAAVTAADEQYFPLTGHGLGTLDAYGYVTASQIPPSVASNRPAAFYTGTASISSSVVSGTARRSLLLATVTIPDPGWPYTVMPFAWVTGSDPNGLLKTRWAGTGNIAKVVVMPTINDTIYGFGMCAASQKPGNYPITPSVEGGTAAKITGGITLGLYGSLLNEAAGSYTFSSPIFFVIVLPAV